MKMLFKVFPSGNKGLELLAVAKNNCLFDDQILPLAEPWNGVS